MTRAADALVALLFPQGCLVCGAAVARRADGVACGACWEDPRVTPTFAGRARCDRCGLPGAGRCLSCAPPELAAVRSIGSYGGALKAALVDLKRRPRVCDRLAALLAETREGEPALAAADVVVPVPLHEGRLVERGHNQAEVIARVVARDAGLEALPNALWRPRRAARRRGGADRAARAETVRGAFEAAPRLVEGRRVLLVDDLYTTGATLGSCARALVAAGAAEVVALTVARVLLTGRGAGSGSDRVDRAR